MLGNNSASGEKIMTLTEFLNYFDFDYRLYDNGTEKLIGLIDLQGVNLGNIENDRFKNISEVLDRLDIYYNDYIFEDLDDVLTEELNVDTEDMNWEDMYHKVQELGIDYHMDILPYIFEDKQLVFDSKDKEVILENWKELDYFVANIKPEDINVYEELQDLYSLNLLSKDVLDIVTSNTSMMKSIANNVIHQLKTDEEAQKELISEYDELVSVWKKERLDDLSLKDALWNCDTLFLNMIAKEFNIEKSDLDKIDNNRENIKDMSKTNTEVRGVSHEKPITIKELKTIEIDKCKLIDSKTRRVEVIGRKTPMEVFNELKEHLKSVDLLPDEYFLPNEYGWDYIDEMPDYSQAECITNWGSNEGIFLDINLAYYDKREGYKRIPFATGKTLSYDGDAFIKMSRIAAECSMMLNGGGRTVRFKEENPIDNVIDKQIERVEKLNSNTPDGIVVDADTILVDLLDKADNEFNGFAQDIFDIYKNSKDKEAVRQMFYEFTDREFEDYLQMCAEEITRDEHNGRSSLDDQIQLADSSSSINNADDIDVANWVVDKTKTENVDSER